MSGASGTKEEDWLERASRETLEFLEKASDEELEEALKAGGSNARCLRCGGWVSRGELRRKGCRLCTPSPDDIASEGRWNVLGGDDGDT